jgi:hypothetical protein
MNEILKIIKKSLKIFVWVWIIGVIIMSSWFAFWLYPETLAKAKNSIVTVFFQAKVENSKNLVYYPNNDYFRELFLRKLSDDNFLYYTKCDLLDSKPRTTCDSSRNWRRLKLDIFNCDSVEKCNKEKHIFDFWEKKEELVNIITTNGKPIDIKDEKSKITMGDPFSWGMNAQWPLFFFFIFLGIKLGKSILEFYFLGNSDEHKA